MASSNTAISVISVAAVLCYVAISSDIKSNVQGLNLKSYSEQQVKGCYNCNQTLDICFDVRKGFMKLLKTTGEVVELCLIYNDIWDQGFIG